MLDLQPPRHTPTLPTPAVPFALEFAGIEFLDSNGVKLMAKPPKAESS